MLKDSASFFWRGGAAEIAVLGLVAVLLMAWGVVLLLRSRPTATERERRRRLEINRTGRMGDATIVDFRDDIVYYSYQVRGVGYTTSQDISDFHDTLPQDLSILIGPVGMKYSPANPPNSIVICELWSGFRASAPQFQHAEPKENSRL